MRFFIVDVKPTANQLTDIEATTTDGIVLGDTYENKFIIMYDELKYDKPTWLNGAEEMNIPGEPTACWNCGALDTDRPNVGDSG